VERVGFTQQDRAGDDVLTHDQFLVNAARWFAINHDFVIR